MLKLLQLVWVFDVKTYFVNQILSSVRVDELKWSPLIYVTHFIIMTTTLYTTSFRLPKLIISVRVDEFQVKKLLIIYLYPSLKFMITNIGRNLMRCQFHKVSFSCCVAMRHLDINLSNPHFVQNENVIIPSFIWRTGIDFAS